MEGRTIVRPDHTTIQLLYLLSIPSMEGRTIVRPDRDFICARFPLL